jgi:hypothetical protein
MATTSFSCVSTYLPAFFAWFEFHVVRLLKLSITWIICCIFWELLAMCFLCQSSISTHCQYHCPCWWCSVASTLLAIIECCACCADQASPHLVDIVILAGGLQLRQHCWLSLMHWCKVADCIIVLSLWLSLKVGWPHLEDLWIWSHLVLQDYPSHMRGNTYHQWGANILKMYMHWNQYKTNAMVSTNPLNLMLRNEYITNAGNVLY